MDGWMKKLALVAFGIFRKEISLKEVHEKEVKEKGSSFKRTENILQQNKRSINKFQKNSSVSFFFQINRPPDLGPKIERSWDPKDPKVRICHRQMGSSIFPFIHLLWVGWCLLSRAEQRLFLWMTGLMAALSSSHHRLALKAKMTAGGGDGHLAAAAPPHKQKSFWWSQQQVTQLSHNQPASLSANG
jgi:hypothetical protein